MPGAARRVNRRKAFAALRWPSAPRRLRDDLADKNPGCVGQRLAFQPLIGAHLPPLLPGRDRLSEVE